MIPGKAVSVIVTTKNSGRTLRDCMLSIKSQSLKNIESIVVDNYSTDSTHDIATTFADYFFSKGPERSAQRNFGASVAEGKYLLFIDADMILSPSLAEECVTLCDGRGIAALYIPEKVRGVGLWVKVRNFERSFYTGTVIDAVRFLKREYFESIGGFDESLTGLEDWDFDRRVRNSFKTGIVSSYIEHDESDFSLVDYVRGKEYYSSWFGAYKKKWGTQDPEIAKQFGIRYRIVQVFVENGRWKKLLSHPGLAVLMIYLRFRVSLMYIVRLRSPRPH